MISKSGNTIETLRDKNLFIEVEKIKYPLEILSKPLRTFPFKVIIDDFEDNLQPGKHDGLKLVKKIISIYKNSK